MTLFGFSLTLRALEFLPRAENARSIAPFDRCFGDLACLHLHRSKLAARIDFHRVALHEFGHVLGLAHVNNDPPGQAIMEPLISNLDHLAADDIAGAELLYGYRITTPQNLGGFSVGQPIAFDITANNNPTSFTAIGLPTGVTLDTFTGAVRGTPLQAGNFQVTVTAHGFPHDVSAVITIEIAGASITSRDPDPIPIGTFFSYTITAGNNPTSFTVTGLPEGITCDSNTGVISGIPDLSKGFTAVVITHGAQYDASGEVHFSITPGYRQPIAQIDIINTTIRTVQDPVRDRLYILQNGNVSVIDTNSLSIVATLPGGVPISVSHLTIPNYGFRGEWVSVPMT